MVAPVSLSLLRRADDVQRAGMLLSVRWSTEGLGCAAGVGVNIKQHIQQCWDDVLIDDTVPLETIIAGMLLEMLIFDEEETKRILYGNGSGARPEGVLYAAPTDEVKGER